MYGPIRELAAREGRIILIGVGLNRMTAIHLAEQQSGRRLFLRWAKATDGRVSMFEVGSCSEGFPRLEPVLRQYARPAVVGDSRWRAFPARQVLDAASTAMRKDQGITDCDDSDCLLCRDSIAGGPRRDRLWEVFSWIRRHLCRPVRPSSTPAVCLDESGIPSGQPPAGPLEQERLRHGRGRDEPARQPVTPGRSCLGEIFYADRTVHDLADRAATTLNAVYMREEDYSIAWKKPTTTQEVEVRLGRSLVIVAEALVS